MKWFEVSKDQDKRITDIANEAMDPSSKLQTEYMSGINYNPSSGLINKDPQMYGGNQAMIDAIQRRTDVRHTKEMSFLKNRAGIDAANDRVMRLTQASQLVNAELQQNAMVRAAKKAAEANRKGARASVLGNVLGIAGGVVGGIYGGPAGAMAGYGLGQGAGQMIGQNS